MVISTPNGLMASQDLLVLPRLRGTPIMVMLSFEASPFAMPPSLVAQATATYTNEKGEPRVSRCDIVLPLALVAFCNSDSKEPNIKFTLHTEEDPVHLPTLYSDMAGSDSGDAAANMVGLAASNRIGREVIDDITMNYYGHSFIANATGEILADLGGDVGVATADFDFAAMRESRASWGMFRDRRTDLYGGLTRLYGQS